jgi:hypothetical protein
VVNAQGLMAESVLSTGPLGHDHKQEAVCVVAELICAGFVAALQSSKCDHHLAGVAISGGKHSVTKSMSDM